MYGGAASAGKCGLEEKPGKKEGPEFLAELRAIILAITYSRGT